MGGCCGKSNAVVDSSAAGPNGANGAAGSGAGSAGLCGSRASVDTAAQSGTDANTKNLFKVLSMTQFSGDGMDGTGTGTGRRGGANGGGAGGAGGAGAGGAGGADLEDVSSQTSVKVAVVVRPMLDLEKKIDAKDIVTITGPNKIKLPTKPQGGPDNGYNFDFDRVFRVDNPSVNHLMFKSLVVPVLERFCQGFNATVLAYGQTGSGKTYTMGTACGLSEIVSSEPTGVIPRLLSLLFQYVQAASEKYEVTLKVSYLELYNEGLNDLLKDSRATLRPGASTATATATQQQQQQQTSSPSNGSRLEIREGKGGEVFVDGLSQVVVRSREDVAALLEQGNSSRAVASHKMNEVSSRSHAIVTLHLEQRAKLGLANSIPSELRYLRSKLQLVDLAGSERVKETGATGDRFAEGVSINKGLLELGNVINALTDSKRSHVPYRNSKLTRVLQDSLGGNSETLFIACVSPADSNHDHTLSTLRYASRARAIRNNLKLNNQLSLEEEVEYLRALCLQLQTENAELKTRLGARG